MGIGGGKRPLRFPWQHHIRDLSIIAVDVEFLNLDLTTNRFPVGWPWKKLTTRIPMIKRSKLPFRKDLNPLKPRNTKNQTKATTNCESGAVSQLFCFWRIWCSTLCYQMWLFTDHLIIRNADEQKDAASGVSLRSPCSALPYSGLVEWLAMEIQKAKISSKWAPSSCKSGCDFAYRGYPSYLFSWEPKGTPPMPPPPRNKALIRPY